MGERTFTNLVGYLFRAHTIFSPTPVRSTGRAGGPLKRGWAKPGSDTGLRYISFPLLCLGAIREESPWELRVRALWATRGDRQFLVWGVQCWSPQSLAASHLPFRGSGETGPPLKIEALRS